jgi:hypothetical protein
MDNAEVFKKIRERGAIRAVVEFSGGNDEGGADNIVLYDREGEMVGGVDGHYAGCYWDHEKGRFAESSLTPEQRIETELAEALEGPVYEEYGSFAGDFSVSGRVTWDAEKGTVTMSGEESEYVPFEKEF